MMQICWQNILDANNALIVQEVALRSWVHCGHKEIYMVSNSTQVDCGV